MAREVERSRLDLRYECSRMKHAGQEARLLASIIQRGFEEPLEGVDMAGSLVLLNGFKRYRCACKLQIQVVPYLSLGTDETAGILSLLRTSNHKSLNLIEQAGFVDELQRARHLSVGQMATDLAVSKGWVSMRLGLMAELSEPVRRELFNGTFPVCAFLYTIRPFMRMNEVKAAPIDEFVSAVSGHDLSVREIDLLAQGFFRGPETFREEIRRGNLAVPRAGIKKLAADPQACAEFERVLLNDLELTQKHMRRVMGKSLDPQLKSRAFHAQSHLLTAGILSRARAFFHTLRQLHDRNGQA